MWGWRSLQKPALTAHTLMSAWRRCNARGKTAQSSFALPWLPTSRAGHKPGVQRAGPSPGHPSLPPGAKPLLLSSLPSWSPAREGGTTKGEGKTIQVELAQAKSCLAPGVPLSPSEPCAVHGPGTLSPPWHGGQPPPAPSPVYIYGCQPQGSFQH